jgi:hypothetical protein
MRSSSAELQHGGLEGGRPKAGTGIKVHFKKHNGEEICTVEANEGDDLVDIAQVGSFCMAPPAHSEQEYDLDIEAACEKSLACSTCHVIMDPKIYDQLEEPSDEENGQLLI